MKTISDYAIHCTEAQTKKALELGAPIETTGIYQVSQWVENNGTTYKTPTAEQMISWLEEQGFGFRIGKLTLTYQSIVTYKGASNRVGDFPYITYLTTAGADADPRRKTHTTARFFY